MRGRKPFIVTIDSRVSKFRYLTPREGTETQLLSQYPFYSLSSDTFLPERGRKPDGLEHIVLVRNRSDTLLPVRGLTYIILSQRKKPTCIACGLLLLVQHVLAIFTRIFDLPHDG